VIGFSSENVFFKETLETNDNLQIVEGLFSEKLGAKIVIRYIITDDLKPVGSEEENQAVKDVLDAFGGKIESRWHNE